MQGFDVDWLAVLAAAVVRFVIGGLWFAPFSFGPAWSRMAGPGIAAAKTRMPVVFIGDFFTGLVMAWVLATLFRALGVTGFVAGARLSLFLWVGFVAMPMISSTLYEGRKFAMFAIVGGFWLVSILAMSGAIAAL